MSQIFPSPSADAQEEEDTSRPHSSLYLTQGQGKTCSACTWDYRDYSIQALPADTNSPVGVRQEGTLLPQQPSAHAASSREEAARAHTLRRRQTGDSAGLTGSPPLVLWEAVLKVDSSHSQKIIWPSPVNWGIHGPPTCSMS